MKFTPCRRRRFDSGAAPRRLIVGFLVTYASLDRIVRSTVQSQATDQLGVQTTLGSADVSILSGSLGLSDLVITSPQGFAAPRMFSLAGTNLKVALSQLTKDPV